MHDGIMVGVGTALNDNPQLNSTCSFSALLTSSFAHRISQHVTSHLYPPTHRTNTTYPVPLYSTRIYGSRTPSGPNFCLISEKGRGADHGL